MQKSRVDWSGLSTIYTQKRQNKAPNTVHQPKKEFSWYENEEKKYINSLQFVIEHGKNEKQAIDDLVAKFGDPKAAVELKIQIEEKTVLAYQEKRIYQGRLNKLYFVREKFICDPVLLSQDEQDTFLALLDLSFNYIKRDFLQIIAYFLQEDEKEKHSSQPTWKAFLNFARRPQDLFWLKRYVDRMQDNTNTYHLLSNHQSRLGLLNMNGIEMATLLPQEKKISQGIRPA